LSRLECWVGITGYRYTEAEVEVVAALEEFENLETTVVARKVHASACVSLKSIATVNVYHELNSEMIVLRIGQKRSQESAERKIERTTVRTK
jgi:hypothetical protein